MIAKFGIFPSNWTSRTRILKFSKSAEWTSDGRARGRGLLLLAPPRVLEQRDIQARAAELRLLGYVAELAAADAAFFRDEPQL